MAFEPNNLAFDPLQESLDLKGIKNAFCFRRAYGERTGQASLYASRIMGGSSLVAANQGACENEIVDIVAGDEFVAKRSLSVPRVVKIDVEGYEDAVVRGLSRTLADPACELVYCEVHPAALPGEIKPWHVSDLFQSLGFAIEEVQHRGGKTFHLIAPKTKKRS